jgi:hypothetical protein
MPGATTIVPRTRRPQGLIGSLVNTSYLNELVDLLNAEGGAVEIDTMLITAAANDSDYTLRFTRLDDQGNVVYFEDVLVTSVAATSIDLLGAQMVAACQANPLVRAFLISTYAAGANTMTFTGQVEGENFTVTRVGVRALADFNAAVVTQAPTTDETITFGRAMITAGFGTDPNEANELGQLPDVADFTAQVMTLDYTYNNASISGVTIVDRHTGRAIASAQVTQAVAKANTTNALLAALNAQLPANSVVVTNVGDALVLTAEKAGLEFDAYWTEDTPATTLGTRVYTTGPTIATSIIRAFRGIAAYDERQPSVTVNADVTGYRVNEVIKTLRVGQMWVVSAQVIAAGEDVWVETAAGATLGLLYNTTSATRLLLSRDGKALAEWVRDTRADTGDNIAAVELSR